MLNSVREVALAPVCLVLSSLFVSVAGVVDPNTSYSAGAAAHHT